MCLESSMKKVVSATQLEQIQEFSPRSHTSYEVKRAAAIAFQPASMQGGEPTTRMVQQVVGEKEGGG